MIEISTESLPELFLERLKHLLSNEQLDMCMQAFAQTPMTVFRCNPLRTTVAQLIPKLEALHLTPQPLSWKADAFAIPAQQREIITHSDLIKYGQIYIQNPSSILPPMLLDPQPGESVLDLTAAPGSKTVQMAGMMQNQGTITAIEKVKSRFYRMQDNIRQQGASNIKTYLKDGMRIWKYYKENFDRILLDAPCSAEGKFKTYDPASYQYWSPKKISDMNHKQTKLLYSAIQCLKPGGTLLYSTCTFAPEENEVVVSKQLKRFEGKIELMPIKLPIDNTMPGITQWQDRELNPAVKHCVRIIPDGLCDGLFLCKIRKL